MQELNTKNLMALSELLDETNDDSLFIKAKVHHSPGQFEESKLLLNMIRDTDLFQIKEKLMNEIENQNKQVFQLF